MRTVQFLYSSFIINRLIILNGNLNLFNKLTDSLTREVKEFTLEQLADYNGSGGKPADVAVNGIVYDVSNEPTWGGVSHFGLVAGKDLSAQFNSSHGMTAILARFPKVGMLK